MPAFIAGLELNRRFYEELVKPLLDTAFPNLQYAAALIGPGSEVLGFDTEMSMDHDWGLRLFLFLQEQDKELRTPIASMLSHQLPASFVGFPVASPTLSMEARLRTVIPALDGPVQHKVIAITVRDFINFQLSHDITQPLHAIDWLTFPSHALGELVAGAIYHDSAGELTRIREQFCWYPHDVWLYMLASGWQRIGQEEHLMPRAGLAGDELGSALIGSRLIRDSMNLCFLMERHYAPYAKWFGTAFKRLPNAPQLEPFLQQAQRALTWQERSEALNQAYSILARMHNMLELTRTMPETVSSFYDRPFQVIHGEQFAQALIEQITDPEIQRIARGTLIGNMNQWSDNTDIEGLDRERRYQLYI